MTPLRHSRHPQGIDWTPNITKLGSVWIWGHKREKSGLEKRIAWPSRKRRKIGPFVQFEGNFVNSLGLTNLQYWVEASFRRSLTKAMPVVLKNLSTIKGRSRGSRGGFPHHHHHSQRESSYGLFVLFNAHLLYS